MSDGRAFVCIGQHDFTGELSMGTKQKTVIVGAVIVSMLGYTYIAMPLSEAAAAEKAARCLGWDPRIAKAIPAHYRLPVDMHSTLIVGGARGLNTSKFACGKQEQVARAELPAESTHVAFIEAVNHATNSTLYYTLLGEGRNVDGSYRFLATVSESPPPGTVED